MGTDALGQCRVLQRLRCRVGIGALAVALSAMPLAAQGVGDGFVISVNGDALSGDQSVRNVARRADVALSNADIQVSYDGFNETPVLTLERVAAREGQVTLRSEMNYPAFVQRGELRVIDTTRGVTLRQLAMAPGATVAVDVPSDAGVAVVHRVYDADGRFDETAPLFLSGSRLGEPGAGVVDIARRRIPVSGGVITVRGSNVVSGASVRALGEAITPDAGGAFEIKRILPAGDYGVDVNVAGPGQRVALTRDVTVPTAEWFSVGVADLTFGLRERDGVRTQYNSGRLAFFVDGKRADGTMITAQADTGEGPLDQMFSRLNERDPRNLLLRVDPADLYPTYGDDSTYEDLTPTSGRFYLRIEKEGNFAQWGDFRAALGDNAFVRSDRALYGAQAYVATRDLTAQGEARAAATVYAAQPDMLPQRDEFRGTGGSVFFLDKQDIAAASESIHVQLRDPDTGRVLEVVQLNAGRDYQINYIQGVVTLNQPLQSSTTRGLFAAGPAAADVVLVAQYEFTPDATDVDGFAYGGRVEGWATDQLRVGLSAMVDETGATDHQVIGADVLYQLTEQTFVKLDYARSEGTGFGNTYSTDGGLIAETIAGAGSAGSAVKLTAQAGLADLGLGTDGTIGGYFERRRAGFASRDVQVTAATGDEDFAGLSVDGRVNAQLRLQGKLDSYSNAAGQHDRSAEVTATYQASDVVQYQVGLHHQDKRNAAEDGSRTDVAARVDYVASDAASLYAFGQVTAQASGLTENHRVGLGGAYDIGNGWTLGAEVSGGSAGTGGQLRADYTDAAGNTRYIGYTLDPTRTLAGVTLNGRDAGRVVTGGRQALSDTVDVFGENSYDMFGRHKALSSAYGVTYKPSTALTYTVAFEFGQIKDAPDYDFDRKALSLGAVYDTEDLGASARVELRQEDGTRAGADVTSDSLLVAARARYKIDDAQRLAFSAELARSDVSSGAPLSTANYSDVVLGYAMRPVTNDRLNILARYRYLYDLYGYRRSGADLDPDGPRQRSHVVSLDASYDVNRHWTIGGKLGYRSAQTAPDAASAFSQNDALLLVASARYHLVSEWDALLELRSLGLPQADTQELGVMGAVYRHMGDNVKLGIGYNFGRFSDDLTDLTFDDKGVFVNLVAKF